MQYVSVEHLASIFKVEEISVAGDKQSFMLFPLRNEVSLRGHHVVCVCVYACVPDLPALQLLNQ